MVINSYRDLEVWQRSFRLCVELYKISKSFPKEELYGLTSQIRRCAVSVPSNIAEGRSRGHRNEFKRFLAIAFASGAELETQLLLAQELGYLPSPQYEQLTENLTVIMKMLNVLMLKLA